MKSWEPRFWSKIEKGAPGECWRWLASTNADGYAQFWADGTIKRAHRLAYELLVGPIPEGKELDHVCRVRSCTNVDHLDLVTSAENNRRGLRPKQTGAEVRARYLAATGCRRGHEYTTANTRVTPDGRRHCRVCKRMMSKKGAL